MPYDLPLPFMPTLHKAWLRRVHRGGPHAEPTLGHAAPHSHQAGVLPAFQFCGQGLLAPSPAPTELCPIHTHKIN